MLNFGRLSVFWLIAGATGSQLVFPEIQNLVSHLPEVEEHIPLGANITARDTSSIVSERASTYWYENIAHQGIAPFAPSGYSVFRNVKTFGAKGDGVTDDTTAINNAILSGGRCGQGCSSSTETPAIVYFPAGTYLISSSILDQYYTNLIGDPTNVPTIKATASFSGFGLIDADKYYSANLNWGSTNVFYRQVRNFILDTTNIPASTGATGIHWPTAQATSLQNIVFNMPTTTGVQHVGLFCESGSAGFATDLTFNGGLIGAQVGNQQFTMRNLVFNHCVTAISQIWDWEWLYQGITINNCQYGIQLAPPAGTAPYATGSVVMIDSTISNTPVGFVTAFSTSSGYTNNSLILENVAISNVPVAVQSTSGATILAGGSTTLNWGEGHEYLPTGPTTFQGPITPVSRPASLLSGSAYYTRSKPTYDTLPVSSFSSVRTAGAKGDGSTDDTAALQSIINSATAAGNIVYFDAGIYRVTSTIKIPAGAKIVGEEYPVIMSSGSFFTDMSNPKPVVQVGTAGATGQVEWSDMIVSTQGAQAGATLIEWNLATSGIPSGMWDVHVRVGGFQGSNLQVAQCPTSPGITNINTACIAAYMSMHITSSASGLYMENNWLWTADHDIETSGGTQISVYAGRGLYIESTAGTFWLVGTSVEHHVLYQYQLANTKNIFMGIIQTESPYYQPDPPAPSPFSVVTALNDPNFATSCSGSSATCFDAWGLRILNSNNILVYGAGLYSFFIGYDGTTCNTAGTDNCQLNIFSLEGTLSNINVYCLGTVGVVNMINQNGVTVAKYSDNKNVYGGVIARYQLASASGTAPTSTSTGKSSTSSVKSTTSSSVKSTTSSFVKSSSTSTKTTTSSSLKTTGASSSTKTTLSTSIKSTTTSKSPVQTGWSFLGCYTDNVSGRALTYGASVPGGAPAMTIELCEATCKSNGYAIAGLEYSGECWCGNSVVNGGGPASDGAAQCTMTCSGSATETCGGPNRLDVYSYGTTTATAALAARSVVAAASATPTASASTWYFRGCYTDSSARTFTYGATVNGRMTVEGCQSACKAAGYTYAGLEYSSQCYCDNSLKNGGALASDGNAQCNMACAGKSSETCGGSWRLDVYTYGISNSSAHSTTPTPTTDGKRGLAYTNADYANLMTQWNTNGKITWGYDWGYTNIGLSSVFEFVPMMWGLASEPFPANPSWTAAAEASGVKYIMGYNEPDLGEQSNVAPNVGAAGYLAYFQPFAGQVKIGMPSVLWNRPPPAGMGWDDSFLGNCTSCTLDFAPIHYYQDCAYPEWFQGNVTQAWNVLQKPIWITEFQCYGTDAQQATFLSSILPWLDAKSYVQRYAYFGVFPGYLLDADGTGLSLAGQAYVS